MKPEKKYPLLEDDDPSDMLNMLRDGVTPYYFTQVSGRIHFSLEDWSACLHLSERTLQRYKKENKTFDTIYSEKIVQIDRLYKRGVDVFGDETKFYAWMDTISLPLGRVKPKELLDTSYGIGLVYDELGRIAHGIFA